MSERQALAVLYSPCDEVWAHRLSSHLGSRGIHIDLASSNDEDWRRAVRHPYDAAIIECTKADLHRVIGRIRLYRAQRRGGVIVTLIGKDLSERDRISALRHGADCCVEKECDPDRLIAIVAALARHPRTHGGSGTLSWGSLQVNLLGGFVLLDSHVIDLQPLQLRILGFLVANAGRVVTCDELRKEVFRVSQSRQSKSIARQISDLRKNLGDARALLVTVPGGYGIGIDKRWDRPPSSGPILSASDPTERRSC